jgi:hypothetical protein
MPSHPLVLATAVQVRLHWTLNGIDAFNVLGGIVAGGYINDQTHADALDAAVKTGYTSSGLKALQAATTDLVSAAIRDVRAANQVEYVGSNASIAGTGGGDPLPNGVAAVVTLRTGKAGKSFRGRAFFGGANEGQNDATGHIVAAYNTALVAFMAAVQSAMGGQGITLAILSRPRFSKVDPFPMIYAGDITAVTAIVTRDTLWDSQRRRKS